MIEKQLVVLLPVIFLASFIVRNVLVKIRTKERIRSSNPILTASIAFISLSFVVTILSASSDRLYKYAIAISFLRFPIISYSGIVLFAISIILGWFVSAQLKESWRVGIHHDQKTRLIQDGIYGYIRNPYFLSYYIMLFSLFLIRPSILILVLVTITIVLFHRMVLEEEVYLRKVHGKPYETYMQNTGRYLPLRHVVGQSHEKISL